MGGFRIVGAALIRHSEGAQHLADTGKVQKTLGRREPRSEASSPIARQCDRREGRVWYLAAAPVAYNDAKNESSFALARQSVERCRFGVRKLQARWSFGIIHPHRDSLRPKRLKRRNPRFSPLWSSLVVLVVQGNGKRDEARAAARFVIPHGPNQPPFLESRFRCADFSVRAILGEEVTDRGPVEPSGILRPQRFEEAILDRIAAKPSEEMFDRGCAKAPYRVGCDDVLRADFRGTIQKRERERKA
jgi:hypothetical protein